MTSNKLVKLLHLVGWFRRNLIFIWASKCTTAKDTKKLGIPFLLSVKTVFGGSSWGV